MTLYKFRKQIKKDYPAIYYHLLSNDCISAMTSEFVLIEVLKALNLTVATIIGHTAVWCGTYTFISRLYTYIEDNEDMIMFRLL